MTDYEDSGGLSILSDGEDGGEEQQLNSRSPQPEETEDTSGYWQDREEDGNGNGNQTLGNERNGLDEDGLTSRMTDISEHEADDERHGGGAQADLSADDRGAPELERELNASAQARDGRTHEVVKVNGGNRTGQSSREER